MAVCQTQSSVFVCLFFPDFHLLEKMSPPIGCTGLKEHVGIRDLLCDQWKGPERYSNTEIPAHQIMHCGS